MPNWNITPEIPDLAMNRRNNYPSRDSWDTVDDGGLNGRSGDLLPHLRFAADNDQVVEPEPGGTYELSGGIHYYDVSEAGIVCDEDNPATIVYTGTDSSRMFTSHGGGADRFVLQGVEFDITEGNADAGVVGGVFGSEFWSKGVTLTGQRDRNYGQRANFTFAPFIGDPSGVAYVENLSMMDGDYIRPDAPFGDHSIAVSTDPEHRGTAIYWQCELNGFGDNNFYCANSPNGRAILVDCYSGNCRGGAFRMGSNDEVIGGVAEQYTGPIELEAGPGHCLSAYYGSPRRFVGVTCRGDLYGNAMILSRDDRNGTPSTTLDRCVVHVDGNNASPLMRLQDGAEWTLKDCYFYDESEARNSFSNEPNNTAQLHDGSSITSDSTWHYAAPNNEDIILHSGSITHENQTWTSGRVGVSSDLGLSDPTPLPEPYFDWGSGGGGGGGDPDPDHDDRLIIARNSATQELESGVEWWVRPV